MPDLNGISPAEYGGYLEISLPLFSDPFPGALRLQSGRSALRALLEFGQVLEIFLPRYICNSVTRAILDSGVAIKWYELDNELLPENLPNEIPGSSRVLYVNYFGLLDKQVETISNALSTTQLIVDNCQALFSSPYKGALSIYSPRKFLGVPDGGFVLPHPPGFSGDLREDGQSYARLLPRLIRAQQSAKSGYDEYVQAENSLENTSPLAMSGLTRRLLKSIDMAEVRESRRRNFSQLESALGTLNTVRWSLGARSVPLCYPLVLDSNVGQIRQELIFNKIYTPTYWPELVGQFEPDSIEYRLLNNCLFLPCDQRYSTSDMDYIAAETARLIDKYAKSIERG